jgi:hypothetical protein
MASIGSLDLKNRSFADARPAFQLTPVGFHDRATDPQADAHAHARALGREHRLKDFFHIFGGNSNACVAYRQNSARVFHLLGDPVRSRLICQCSK